MLSVLAPDGAGAKGVINVMLMGVPILTLGAVCPFYCMPTHGFCRVLVLCLLFNNEYTYYIFIHQIFV
tara:strand:+ start:1170 stop:1373 length:204 start_codon:yes stop_codon:yes gene_type:complete